MSRWTDRFKDHAFQATWASIKHQLTHNQLSDDADSASIEELGRLKKIISYIDGLLESIDPELFPMPVLGNFNEQAVTCLNEITAFATDKDIGHIRNANANADNLLTYVKPYMVAGGRTAKALRQAAQTYSESLTEFAALFKSKAELLLKDITSDKSIVESAKAKALDDGARLKSIAVEFLGDGNEQRGAITDLRGQISDFVEKRKQVLDFYEQLLVGSESEIPTKSKIEAALLAANVSKKKADELAASAATLLQKIQEFDTKIFGIESDSGDKKDGIAFAIDAQVQRMDEFEKQQKIRYTTLNEQIEALLPGATSAGLATAYKDMKDSFSAPIQTASRVFYYSVGAIVVFSFALAVKHIGLDGVEIFHLTDWNSVLRSFAYKAPLYIPLVWLAYYASKRRSECQRLQQEYAHKEALAKSYDSYKKQIEGLGEEDKTLLKHLMQKSIDAIAYNASQTLDGKHGDKMPMQEAVEKGIDNGIKVSVKGAG